jgi:DNA repair protein RAD50
MDPASTRHDWNETTSDSGCVNTVVSCYQIKADMEGTAGRSYNYRVVMRCGDADLEMRGRCSAGQKVLTVT